MLDAVCEALGVIAASVSVRVFVVVGLATAETLPELVTEGAEGVRVTLSLQDREDSVQVGVWLGCSVRVPLRVNVPGKGRSGVSQGGVECGRRDWQKMRENAEKMRKMQQKMR